MLELKAIVTGDAALQAKLEALGSRISNKAMVTAARAGTKALADAIKRIIPEAKTPGHDMKHIRSRVGTKVKSNRREGITKSKVGFDVGKKRPRANAANTRAKTKGTHRQRSAATPHAHLLAAGTGIRRTRLTRANRGRIAAANWIPRAVASNGAAVGSLMESKLREVIYDEARQ